MAQPTQSGLRCGAKIQTTPPAIFPLLREVEKPRQSTFRGKTRSLVEHDLPASEPIFAFFINQGLCALRPCIPPMAGYLGGTPGAIHVRHHLEARPSYRASLKPGGTKKRLEPRAQRPSILKTTNIRLPTPTISRSFCTTVLRTCCWRPWRMTTSTSFRRLSPYLAPFHQLFDMVPRDGLIVAATERFLAEAKLDVVTFGLTRRDWRAQNIEYGAVSQFTLTERGREVARVKTTQLGSHDIENMVGIGAFVLTRGLASVEQYTTAMASFRGVMRRLDRKSDRTSVQMFEGFGSSYERNAGRSSQDGKHGAFGFAGLVFALDACTLKRESGEVVALTPRRICAPEQIRFSAALSLQTGRRSCRRCDRHLV